MEEVIFYIIAFIIGTFFGSFMSLAVYRIPLHQDITHERSYCPKCKHKLTFFDMIPVLSYIFLGGKCRYCKEKIRIRYLLLEILTGIIFLLFAMSLNISFETLEISKIINLGFIYLYLIGIIIIAGIDKERRTIQKSVLLYEIAVEVMYMVYLCILQKANIYRYAMYLLVICFLLIFDNIYFKRKLKNNYTIEILELSTIITIFCREKIYIATAILTLLSIAINYIEKKVINHKNKTSKENISYYKNLPIGFYLVCCNIVSFIVISFASM